MEEKQLIIRFSGTKKKLHKQLKMWCLKNEKAMNTTVVELIENHLKK